MEHVVEAIKLARGLDADDVVRLLHHAQYFLIARCVAAKLAEFAFTDVVTDRA